MKLNTKGHTTIFHLKDLPSWTLLICVPVSILWLLSCTNTSGVAPHQEIVTTPEQMNEKVPDIIKKIADHIAEDGSKIDSITILQPTVIQSLYAKSNEAKWSREEKLLPIADSVMTFIQNSMLYGLFPEDYHFKNISSIKERMIGDTLARKDAVLWAKADVLLTDAM